MVHLKHSLYYFSIFVFSILASGCASAAREPVNPDASPEARELLSMLYQIRGEKVMSGQHNYGHQLTRSTDTVVSITGKYPAVWGFDLGDGQRWERTVPEAVRQHENGSTLTGMSHMSRPFEDHTVSRSTWRDLSEEQWEDMVTPGTEMHQLLIERIDDIAVGLKKLRDKDIPVLWRPFHEMNGIWFWWGNKPGPDGFTKLWHIMYDRYVNDHELNNLLWVWNPNAPRDWEDDEAYTYELFYPGHEVVDILAADVYKNDFKQSHHDELLELADGKVIALGEVGQLPTPEILEEQPMWTWFMCWATWIWKNNDPEDVKKLYEDERVMTRDEL